MEFVLTALSYLFWVGLALSILVFIHELGHFLAAKAFGMRVEQFSIGFPPRLFGKTVGETEYRVGAVPLGGYVKISGMIDESMDADWVEREPEPWEFRSKPVWQRIVVITAGVVFNIILAFLIFIGIRWHYGDTYVAADEVPVYVAPGSPAADIGIETGDRIVAVNGRPWERFDDRRAFEAFTADSTVFTVDRAGRTLALRAPDDLMNRLAEVEGDLGIGWLPPIVGGLMPGGAAAEAGLRPGDRIVALDGEPLGFWEEMVQALGRADGDALAVRFARPADLAAETEPAKGLRVVGRTPDHVVYEATLTPTVAEGRLVLGVNSATSDQLRTLFGVEEREYGFGEAVVLGSEDAAGWIALYGRLIKRLFTGQDDLRQSVGGPLMIAKAAKDTADRSIRDFWQLVANLSIALAVFNILPIPVLDGGHLVFLLYEGITRREPSVRVRMVVQQVGMVLILAFMAFVIFNDAMRLF